MKIVVAKNTQYVCHSKAKQTRIFEVRATTNKPFGAKRTALGTLLCFSIWSMRDSISFPEDMRCVGRAGRAG